MFIWTGGKQFWQYGRERFAESPKKKYKMRKFFGKKIVPQIVPLDT